MNIQDLTENIQYRSFEITNSTPEGIIDGYLSTYNDVDSYGTFMLEGAFDEAIKKYQKDRYLVCLWQHNCDQPIGRWIDLSTDEKGLFGKIKLTLDDPLAKVALAHVQDGSVRGLSIGFRVKNEDIVYDKTRKAYGIKSISLVECSLVTFPANKEATITDVKNEGITLMNTADNKTVEDTETIEVNTEVDTLRSEIDNLKRTIADITNPVIANNENTHTYEQDFHSYLRTGKADFMTRDDPVSGATTPDDNGGYLVPDGLDKRVVELLDAQSVIRRNATIITPEGNKYERPYKKTGVDAGWVSETGARVQTSAQTYDMITAELGELYAFPMYTQRFLADSWYNVEAAYVSDLAKAFTEKEETAFISGDGTNKPKGILTTTLSVNGDSTRAWNAMQKINSESATDITLEGLIRAKDSLNNVYKSNAKWYMNTNTYTDLQLLLKDTTERRVFGNVDVSTDAPVRLLGYPIEICDYLPDIAAGANPILFGDMRAGYAVLDRPGIGVVRDALTNKPYIGLYSIKRVGGMVQDFRALKVINVSVSS